MNNKVFINLQQSELNAAIMYRALSEIMKNETDKKLLLSLAADEGRHAGVLKEVTDTVLKPKSGMAKTVSVLYRLIGKKALFSIISKIEFFAGKIYGGLHKNHAELFEQYPKLKRLAADEKKHGELLKR